MKNRALIRENIRKNNPIFNVHKHCFTYNHVPNDFRSIKISKNKVLGLPMKEWFMKPLSWLCDISEHIPFLPQSTRNTVAYTKNFLNMIDRETSMEIHEASLPYESNTIHSYLMMDLRLGCRGVMNKSIDEQAQELMAVRDKYPDSVLIFWAVDPNQPDMLAKAIYALEVLKFDGIKAYWSEGYEPTHPELMKLWAYCEKNKIPVVSHNASANMHHPDWKYRIYGKTLQNGVWVDTDKTVKLSNETQVAQTYNYIRNLIPVFEAYPDIYWDIAHFGGGWDDYLAGKKDTWQQDVIDIVSNPKYRNVYTDFSYTLSTPKYSSGLKTLLLNNKAVANKVLFGTDWYMVFMEGNYGDIVKLFLQSLGQDLYEKLCRVNPKNFYNLN